MACGKRCVWSPGPKSQCQCSCGGKNHGTGLASATPDGIEGQDLMAALHEGIQPLEVDEETVRRRKQAVRDTLGDEMEVKSVRLLGSYARDTAIRGSDADYFVILSRETALGEADTACSDDLLNRVRDALRSRYPLSEIAKDGQAVVIDFNENPADVVPAIYQGPVDASNGYPVYEIPDGEGGWLATAPGADSKYLRDADARSQGRLKGLVRLLKAWKQTREATADITSLYIEMALAESGAAEGPPLSRAELFVEGLRALDDARLEPMPSPHGVGDDIAAVHGFFAGIRARTGIEHALDHASRAVEAEQEGDDEEADDHWAEVFNHRLVSA